MNYRIILHILGWVLNLQGIFMLLPCLVGVIYKEYHDSLIYFILSIICTVIGIVLRQIKTKNTTFFAKEGFVAVSLSWIILSITGALPFVLNGDIPSFTNALFEIISGYTTTGSSILTDVEALSHANLLFRSFSHWIGGMGVLVFILAILPMTGGSTMNLLKAESPGPSVGKLVPKMQQTALYLYAIYIALTVIQFIVLLLGGMPVFDSLCHTFATAGTGGFGIKNDSLASYAPHLQVIITFFMFVFGVNFSFYYYILIRRVRDAIKMEEVHWYVGIFIGAIVLIMINLVSHGYPFLESLRHTAFQVSTIITTTGYATTDFNLWPEFSKGILVCLMFSGACAGSTAGGLKISRIMLYVKQIHKELMQQIHPKRVHVIKIEGKPLPYNTAHSCNVLLMTYIFVFIVSYLLISLNGFDATTNFTAIAATLNNIGPGLNVVGPTGNFSEFSTFSKYVLMFDMLAGRLEIIPMVLLFYPSTWKK